MLQKTPTLAEGLNIFDIQGFVQAMNMHGYTSLNEAGLLKMAKTPEQIEAAEATKRANQEAREHLTAVRKAAETALTEKAATEWRQLRVRPTKPLSRASSNDSEFESDEKPVSLIYRFLLVYTAY